MDDHRINHLHDVKKLKIMSGKEFYMNNLGDITTVLRIEIQMDKSVINLRLSQIIYFEKVIYKFSVNNSKDVSTLWDNQFKPSLDKFSKTGVEAKYKSNIPYTNVFCCLMYVIVCTRLDLTQAIS